MQIREIKVGKLLDFIAGEEYQNLDMKPITEARAISQYYNPDAEHDDLALIYAAENNELLGFAGLLPKKINGEKIKVYANTCWWADQTKGNGIAIPIFYQLLNRANSKLFLSESTFHAKSILEKTGLFGQIISHPGIRGFIRFYFADIVLKKLPHKKWLTKPIIFVDFVLNLLVQPYRNIFMSKYKKSGYLVEEVEKVEGEIERFIEKHSSMEFVQKTAANFEWFKNYPWVKKSNEKESIAYPFTHQVKEYELNYYVLKKGNEIKAFVAISYRDNLSKIPYIYFDNKDIKDVFYSVMNLILKKKYDSLVVFHPAIVDFMNQNKMPFLYRKTELKYSGTTKQIYNFFEQRPIFQDGDGDVIFT